MLSFIFARWQRLLDSVQVDISQNISNVTNAFITSLFISGTDVYTAGLLAVNYNNGQAAYWKNGQLVTLPNGSSATGIAVVGN